MQALRSVGAAIGHATKHSGDPNAEARMEDGGGPGGDMAENGQTTRSEMGVEKGFSKDG